MKRAAFHLRNVLGVLLLVAVLAQVTLLNVSHAATQGSDETVTFNTKTLKFHCSACTWAKKCTSNCIQIQKSEALRRGGVACKICGGTCQGSKQGS